MQPKVMRVIRSGEVDDDEVVDSVFPKFCCCGLLPLLVLLVLPTEIEELLLLLIPPLDVPLPLDPAALVEEEEEEEEDDDDDEELALLVLAPLDSCGVVETGVSDVEVES
jgi:hypothetical protein